MVPVLHKENLYYMHASYFLVYKESLKRIALYAFVLYNLIKLDRIGLNLFSSMNPLADETNDVEQDMIQSIVLVSDTEINKW
jgi:hypothetical protein